MRRATIPVAAMALVAGIAAAKQNAKNQATYNYKGTLEEFAVTAETKVESNEEKVDLTELVVGVEVEVQSKTAKDAT